MFKTISTLSQETRTPIDTDGDGIPDRFAVDTDGDGNIDRIEFDPDQDGNIDRITHYAFDDEDGTRRVTRREVDLDDDGNIDRTIHLNAEGRWERVGLDVDDDGTIDRTVHRNTDGSGTINRIDFDDDADGTTDRSEFYTHNADSNRTRIDFDDDADGTIDRTVHLNAEGRWERVELDVDDDGTTDRIETYTYDENGNRTRAEFDDGADGTTDRSEFYTHNADSNRTRIDFDDDADGTIDRTVHLNAEGRWERVELDVDDDGTTDRIETYTYDENGNRTRAEFDDGADGMTDRAEDYRYNSIGRLIRTNFDDDNDGTTDRSEDYGYFNDRLTRIRFDDDEDNTFDRSETYTYDENGRLTRIEFDDDGDNNPDRRVAYTYDANGNRNRTEFDDDADGTIDRITHFTFDSDGNRSVTRRDADLDDDGNIDRTIHLNAEGRWERVEWDDDDDGTIDRTVHRNTDGSNTLNRTDFDGDGDGTTDRSEFYTQNADGNRDRANFDDDADGTIDRSETYSYDANDRVSQTNFDDDNDGTTDRSESYTYDANDRVSQTEFDDDNDGTTDRSETYTYDGDGNRTRTDFDDDNDGTTDRSEVDDDADGNIDRVNVTENRITAYRAPDADGDTLVYSLSGTDSALFTIDANTGEVSFIEAPDFEAPGDANGDNVYDIIVTASDGATDTEQAVAITVTNDNDNAPTFTSPATANAQENQTAAYMAAATDADGDTLVYSLSGTDGDLFTIDANTGEVSFRAAPDFEAPGDDGGDNVYDIIVTASDGSNSTNHNVAITVTDVNDLVPLVPLSSLDGSNGFILNGIDTFDDSGRSVSSAGDVNGDGYDDLIIGTSYADPNGGNSGETYIVYGGASAPGTGGVLDLSDLDGSNGFILNGIDAGDLSGWSVSSAGDVNGDGYDDLIIGAYSADPNGDSNAGETYIVYGGASAPGTGGVLDLGALNGTNGFTLTGIDAGDRSGSSVSSAGDVNGDGYDDLIIGARRADPNGASGAGETYVIYGGASAPGTGGVLDLGALDGSNGFTLNGIDGGDVSGSTVSSAGDINGDGYDDLIIGAHYGDPNGDSSAGETYIVYGGASAPGTGGVLDLGALNGTNGFTLTGIDAGDRSGSSVSSAGDVNGDGYDDLIIGANRADPDGDSNAGETYVVYGGASAPGTGGVLDLGALNGTNGFILNGIDADDQSGWSVSSAGDINGDGYDDLIIGAYGADGYAGETYVVYGGASAPGTGGVLDLSALDGTNGFTLTGIDARDYSGTSVSSAGDVNGDGYDDLIIGANGADDLAGETYVIYGGATGTESLTLVTASGTAAVDNFTGNAGDDSFTAIATNDVVRGGAGDDMISVTALDFAAIDGGTGQDTLVLDGAGLVLDLTGAGHASVDSVEVFDLSGTGANSLVLDAQAVFDVTEERAGGVASLDVLGDADDRVDLSGSSFALTGTAAEDGVTYNVYRDGNAQLRIENGVQVQIPVTTTLPVFTSPTTANAQENQTAAYMATATDADGDTLAYSLSGTDAALFTIDADTGEVSFIEAPDFEAPGDDGGDNIYDIIVTASDGINSTNHNVAITVTNDNDNAPTFTSPATANAQENQIAAYMAAATDADGDTLVYSLSGTDAALFTIDANTGEVSFIAAPDFEAPGDANGDNVYDIIVTASDGSNSTDHNVAITVTDEYDLIPLSSLDGSNGFTLNGIDSGDYSGISVSSAGDVNGDGYDDLIIGAIYADPNGDNSGETYIVYGGASAPGTGGRFNLSTLDGSNGFILNGIDETDLSGFSVSSAGDVNGDGYDDLIIGAYLADPNGDSNAGETYIVYGGASPPGTGGRFNLSTLDGSNGFILTGIDANDQSGRSVSSAGDVNGDGYDDLIIGANGGDPNGETYVIYGGANAPGSDGVLDLSDLDGTNGFILTGIDANDFSGRSVSSAGDVNGDGYDDLIIGANRADPNEDGEAGETYVVYGGASAPGTGGRFNLSTLDGSNGFILNGIDAYDRSGTSVSSAGDVNGDGYDDLIIGAYGADGYAGEIYVVYGGANAPGTGGVLDLGALNGTNGFTLTGIDAGDRSGSSVSSAGDVNGDGYDDLIIGARNADPNGNSNAGETYIVYGGASAPGTGGVLDLSDLDGTNGFILTGIDGGDRSGRSVSSAGDVNGDGYDDLIIGASGADPNGRSSLGETYVVYGGATGTESLTPVTASGTAAADNFTGNAGNDSFTAIATNDVVRGGAGNDRISVTALDFAAIDGGTGADRLVLDGAGLALDLTGPGNAGVDSVELFDLSGTGANSLVLDAQAVFDVTEEREGGAASLDVLGDADDRVDLSGSSFALAGTATEDGVTYNVYRDGNAEVRIEDGITVTLAATGSQSARSKTDTKTDTGIDPVADTRTDPRTDPGTDPGSGTIRLDEAIMNPDPLMNNDLWNNDLWDDLWANGVRNLDQPVHIDEDAILIPLSDPLSFGPLASGPLPGPWGDLMCWPGLESHPAMQNDLAMILPEMEIVTADMEGF